VPDFLAAGPRDVLVPASEAQVARDLLLQPDPGPPVVASGLAERPLRVVVGVLAAVALVAIIVWLGAERVLQVANGDNDRMIPTKKTHLLAGRLPHARS
jgi:hypothetical protein